MNQDYGKKEKLKSKIVIDSLFSEGNSIKKYPLRLIYLPLPGFPEKSNLAGVSVPKRNFKRAVDRIKIKRLMREAYRKNKYLVTNNLDSSYAFLLVYTGREMSDYHSIFKATNQLLEKFVQQEKNKNDEKGTF